jgi:hypothetical protein
MYHVFNREIKDKMDTATALAVLRAELNSMYPNGIPPIEEDKYTERPVIDYKRLKNLLLKGCRYPPTELETGVHRTAGKENTL